MARFPAWIVAVACVGLALRWVLAYHGHSGLGKAPMRGDFEAQRHWVEITNALPPADWYRNTTSNDLLYWGLDYPPLSAWHARLIWPAARVVMMAIGASDPARVDAILDRAFALLTSRGNEDPHTITIMRAAALVTDALFYVLPALWLLWELQAALGNAEVKTREKNLRAEAARETTSSVPQLTGMTYLRSRDKISQSKPSSPNTAAVVSSAAEDDADGDAHWLAPSPLDGVVALSDRDGLHWWHVLRFPASSAQATAVALLLTPPAQCWIDHGHFQFNAAALGPLVACAAIAVRVARIESSYATKAQGGAAGRVFASVLYDVAFCAVAAASIMFKQMSLYFSLGLSAYMAERALSRVRGAGGTWSRGALTLIGGAVGGFGVLAACLAPPLIAADVLTRMFPFGRGLYEDKVANVWCAISLVVKMPALIPDGPKLVRFCAASTVVAALPAVVAYVLRAPALLVRRRVDPQAATPLDHVARFGLVLAASSLAFFLFSFQVHEKGIMMPACGLTLAAAVAVLQPHDIIGGPSAIFRDGKTLLHLAVHFHAVALFSMAPLAVKDDHMPIPYGPVFALLCWWSTRAALDVSQWRYRLTLCSIALMVTVHAVHVLNMPPARYPDIVTLAYSIVGCAHFLVALGLITLLLLKQR
jgi:hypothetical protein